MEDSKINMMCGNNTIVNTADSKVVKKFREKEDILYKLARLVRGTDCIAPTMKGRMYGDLLSQLRILDGEKYDRLVLERENNEKAPLEYISYIKIEVEKDNEAV